MYIDIDDIDRWDDYLHYLQLSGVFLHHLQVGRLCLFTLCRGRDFIVRKRSIVRSCNVHVVFDRLGSSMLGVVQAVFFHGRFNANQVDETKAPKNQDAAHRYPCNQLPKERKRSLS